MIFLVFFSEIHIITVILILKKNHTLHRYEADYISFISPQLIDVNLQID